MYNNITRKEAVAISTKKWAALAKGKLPLHGRCGFCIYCRTNSTSESNYTCKKYCPLFPDICCNLPPKRKKVLYWEYSELVSRSPEAKVIAKKILAVIKERGRIWIKQEER